MDETTRLASDMQQLTKRVDDLSFRVAGWEARAESLESKISTLGQIIDLKLTAVNNSVAVWNRIGMVILSAFLVSVVGVVVAFALAGGFNIPR